MPLIYQTNKNVNESNQNDLYVTISNKHIVVNLSSTYCDLSNFLHKSTYMHVYLIRERYETFVLIIVVSLLILMVFLRFQVFKIIRTNCARKNV